MPFVPADIGFFHAFGADFDIEPIASLTAQRDHGQTHSIAGNRRADIDGFDVIFCANPRTQIAALFKFKNFANIGDNAGEHSSAFHFVMPEVSAHPCFGKGWSTIWP